MRICDAGACHGLATLGRMLRPPPTPAALPAEPQPQRLIAYYRSGEALRSRSLAPRALTATLALPAVPARLVADWQRETRQQLQLEPGDVEVMPLARSRARWPGLRDCVQAMAQWARSLGLQELLSDSELALMACRGARYHHDALQYGGLVFGNLFLSEERGLDLHFPSTGQRIPLVRGTAVLFDTGLPHAVIARHSAGFQAADFPDGQDCDPVFLSWELPVENAQLAQLLGIGFDTDPATALLLQEEQLRRDGAPARLCPESGRWL